VPHSETGTCASARTSSRSCSTHTQVRPSTRSSSSARRRRRSPAGCASTPPRRS
jgi:hypothetical protein